MQTCGARSANVPGNPGEANIIRIGKRGTQKSTSARLYDALQKLTEAIREVEDAITAMKAERDPLASHISFHAVNIGRRMTQKAENVVSSWRASAMVTPANLASVEALPNGNG